MHMFFLMMTLPMNIWSRSRFHVSLKKCLVLSKMWQGQRRKTQLGMVYMALGILGLHWVYTTLPMAISGS